MVTLGCPPTHSSLKITNRSTLSMEWTPFWSPRASSTDTVSCTFTYHTWHFIIFTIFTITACIFSYSLSVSFWTKDLALQQILSSIDLFLYYRTDYTDYRTIYNFTLLNGCTGKCVRLSRLLAFECTLNHCTFIHSFIHSFIQWCRHQMFINHWQSVTQTVQSIFFAVRWFPQTLWRTFFADTSSIRRLCIRPTLFWCKCNYDLSCRKGHFSAPVRPRTTRAAGAAAPAAPAVPAPLDLCTILWNYNESRSWEFQ